MARLRNWRIGSALAALAWAAAAFTLEVPAGTEIQIRLKSKVSTQSSRANDPVEAVVIAPVMLNNQFAVPDGAIVRGAVEKAVQSSKADERSVLVLSFNEIEISGAKTKLAAQVVGVDNAREKVDQQGQINGILASETVTGQLDSEISKLNEKFSGLADVLNAAKSAVMKPPEGDITYDPGVEMTLKLTAPLALAGPSEGGAAFHFRAFPDETTLVGLVTTEPFQTMAQKPSKASDITNIMIIGTGEQIAQAFQQAGWANAAGLTGKAKFETLRALAEDRGYSEAPVSVLLLDGKPPDAVFEKMNNTFAHRHHLRLWRRPEIFQGTPVWVAAATHDTGINFSQQNRTFIHRVDSEIDRERAKVVNDLIFTGRVQSVALVERDNVPQHSQNATGDNLDTDGKMAVLMLK